MEVMHGSPYRYFCNYVRIKINSVEPREEACAIAVSQI
jgi:hypothetical protein